MWEGLEEPHCTPEEHRSSMGDHGASAEQLSTRKMALNTL